MPIYHYQSGSVLDRVSILTNESGGSRAYLHAGAGASTAQLAQLQQVVSAAGWKSVPIVHEGQPALEVRGFKKPQEMVNLIQQQGWGTENMTVYKVDGDVRTGKEKRANSTLKFAGISYILGDIGYMFYAVGKFLIGKKQNVEKLALPEMRRLDPALLDMTKKDMHLGEKIDKLDIAAGVGYTAGSWVLALYGSRDQSQNTIETATKKVNRFLREGGLQPEETSSLKQITTQQKQGFFQRIDHTLAKYPSEVLNSIYMFVGAALTLVGTSNVFAAYRSGSKKELYTEIAETGLGVTTALSALAGLAIKEKKRDPEEPRKTGVAGIWEWIQEKPLRATGIGFMAATGFHAWGTHRKWKAKDEKIRKTIVGRGVFIAANVFSEIMLALSSKGHGTGVKPDDSVDTTVIAAAAETIARQPQEKQQALMVGLANYMALPDVLDRKFDDVYAKLQEHVLACKNNPWLPVAASAAPTAVASKTEEVAAQPQTPSTHVQAGERAAPMRLVEPVLHAQAMPA